MLEQSYFRKTDEIIEHYGRGASSLIPIMQDIQAEYRYLPGELLTYVAKEIGITEAKAYSVATFYENFSFEAKGKYVIKVCDGTACHVRKSTPVLEALWKELQKVVSGAARMFVDTRVAEGEHLKADLLARMEGMQRLTDFISERFPRVMEEYRRKLEDKVRELLAGTAVDEGRLLTEVTIFADKICVDEEIVRLRSHIETARTSLQEGGPVGRKLDFIAQEMNREANTILSKANDLDTSNCCLDLKTEIEKVREQIQNIE